MSYAREEVRRWYAPLDRETERDLIAAAQDGDAAASERLVRSQLAYCMHAAARYSRRARCMPFEDCYQVAKVKVAECVAVFDLSRDTRFGTLVGLAVPQALSHVEGAYRPGVCVPQCHRSHKPTRERVAALPAVMPVDEAFDAPSEGPEAGYDDREEADVVVGKILAALPPGHASVLRALYGLGGDECARDWPDLARRLGLDFPGTRAAVNAATIAAKKVAAKLEAR